MPYEGSLYEWFPHHDDSEPCALTCKGRPVSSDENLIGEPILVIARLADKVEDGTRCREGSLDMCIGGKCQVCSSLIQYATNFFSLENRKIAD